MKVAVDSIYEASRGQVVAGCPAHAQRVLLVGHNPGLEDLLAYLCDALPIAADGKLLPAATVGHLAMPADWTQLEHGAAAQHHPSPIIRVGQ
ncbi:MAG: hypothetical protein R3F37_02110 [Candidatus Competibacteraceae bacterium]